MTWNEGGYSDIDPYESYRAVFNGSLAMYQNPELIFSRGRNQGANSIAEMAKLQMPKTLGGGSNAYGMTQKMCDAYYMANGDEFSREHFKEEYPSGTRFVTKKEVEAGTYPQLKEGVYKEYANRNSDNTTNRSHWREIAQSDTQLTGKITNITQSGLAFLKPEGSKDSKENCGIQPKLLYNLLGLDTSKLLIVEYEVQKKKKRDSDEEEDIRVATRIIRKFE